MDARDKPGHDGKRRESRGSVGRTNLIEPQFNMAALILRRLLLVIPVLFGVSVIVFLVISLIPGF